MSLTAISSMKLGRVNYGIEVIVHNRRLFLVDFLVEFSVQFLLFTLKEFVVTSVLEFLQLLMPANFCFLSSIIRVDSAIIF